MDCSPFFFFFNDTATTEIYTLSLHDALPIYAEDGGLELWLRLAEGVGLDRDEVASCRSVLPGVRFACDGYRSEEHTSELQSPCNLVCRLLLEKKKNSTSKIVQAELSKMDVDT